MFKKTLALLAFAFPILSISASISQPLSNIEPFIHAYIGIGPALNMQFFQSDYLDFATDTYHVVNYGNYGASGQLHAGYNRGFISNSVIGLDVHAQYNGTSASVHSHNNIPAYHSNQMPWQFGISPKIGYVLNHNLFYILAGPEWAQIKNHEVSESGQVDIQTQQYKFGGLFGFGLSQNISPNLNIVEQFSYGIYQGFTQYLANGDSSMLKNPADVTVLLALKYHFG